MARQKSKLNRKKDKNGLEARERQELRDMPFILITLVS